jgi:Na+-driven multidrug efflux pump
VLLAGACAIGSTAILEALQTPAEMMDPARSYLYSMLVAFPFLTLSVYLQSACRSVGDSAGPLVAGAVGCALEAVLDPVLMQLAPAVGIPAIAGAGMGTAVSSAVAILLILRRLPEPVWKSPSRTTFISTSIGIGEFALPVSLQLLALGASSVVLFAIVNSVGTTAAAAFSATTLIWTYINLPIFELGSTLTTAVAQNHDQLTLKRFFNLLKVSGAIAISFCLPILLLAFLLGPVILTWLLRSSPEATSIAISIHQVYLLTLIPTAIAATITGALRARGYVWSLFTQQMVVAFGIQIPVAAYLWPDTSSNGIWMSIGAYAAAWLIGVGLILSRDLFLMNRSGRLKNG